MKVNRKKIDKEKVVLACVATAEEVNNALHTAQVAFATSMGLVPQKDKTVAQVAEERMGIKNLDSIVESQAIEALIPLALDKKNIIPAYPPKAEAHSPFQRGRQFAFELEVALKPDYELTSYEPVEITVPPFTVDESEVDRQIEEMAANYTFYETADPKPLEKGDSCLVAMKCFENGKELKGLTTESRTYTAGMGYMPEGFDEGILGMQPGETRTFTFEGPGFDENFNEITQTIDCTLTLKEIQKPAKPVIDDAWVEKNMPWYKSFEDMRATMLRGIEQNARAQYESYQLQLVANEISKRFQGAIADEQYESMRNTLMNNIRMELKQQGKTWDDFVKENGGEQQLGMMLMLQARQMLVQGFALDAVFRHEHLVLTDADIEGVCRSINPQMSPKQLRQQFEQQGRGFALRESAERYKANQWLLEHAKVTVAEEPQASEASEEA